MLVHHVRRSISGNKWDGRTRHIQKQSKHRAESAVHVMNPTCCTSCVQVDTGIALSITALAHQLYNNIDMHLGCTGQHMVAQNDMLRGMLDALHPLLQSHVTAFPSLIRLIRRILEHMGHVITSTRKPKDALSRAHRACISKAIVSLFTPLDLCACDELLLSLDSDTFAHIMSSSQLTSSSEDTHFAVIYAYLQGRHADTATTARLLRCIRWIHLSPMMLREIMLQFNASGPYQEPVQKHVQRAMA